MLITFNVPVADSEHADRALKAAREIQDILSQRTFGGARLRTRIGINTGMVIAGNVGSGERVNYTVHGDAVNLGGSSGTFEQGVRLAGAGVGEHG